jgi:hypothetical protein
MMIRSLRGRVLLASVLWTGGLLFLVSFALAYVMDQHPHSKLAATCTPCSRRRSSSLPRSGASSPG